MKGIGQESEGLEIFLNQLKEIQHKTLRVNSVSRVNLDVYFYNIKMAKRTGPTNVYLSNLIAELKRLGNEKNINLWKRVAYELERSTRKRREVNISRINSYAKEGEIALVPGKILSMGELDKKITVASWKFSKNAEEKINRKGNAITIQELIKQNPEGKKVRIIG